MILLQAIVNGLGSGAIYGCVAVGLTLIFYVTRMVQVAHGQVLMVGAYAAVYIIRDLVSGNPILGGILTFLACFALGLVIERLLLRPFQGRGDDYPVIVITIALGLLISEIVRLRVNAGISVQFPATGWLTHSVRAGSIRIGWASVSAFVLLIVSAAAIQWVLQRSRSGLALRSMASNIETAKLLGVRVGRMAAITVAFASAIAGLAGMFAGYRSGSVVPTFGDLIGLKGLAVGLFVGLGNVKGAVIGGLILGILEALVTTYTNGSYQDAIAFGMIVVILLVRPNGLLGAPRELLKDA